MYSSIRVGGIFVAAALFTLLQPLTSFGGAGTLDSTFGGTGKIKIGFGGGDASAQAVIAQSDGKLILAGSGSGNSFGPYDFLIARIGTNNLPDVSFGGGGKVFTHFNTNGVGFGSTIRAVRLGDDD